MDLSSPTLTTNTYIISPVFGDNVQDLLGVGALHVNPSAIITVNSIADVVDDLNSGVTTLRDAINQANGDTGEDLIVFDRSLFSSQQTITLGGTELDITHNLDIIAPRDPLTGGDLVTVSGNNASRVFEIEAGATVSIDGLIVADGSVTGDNGGGIKNSGTLTLDSSIVRNNSANATGSPSFLGGYGGGIYSIANLTVTNSTISGNLASRSGGGIYSAGGATVSNSTISANTGSGISSNQGTFEVSNSTISANTGSGISNEATVDLRNGGVFNQGTVEVSNSTISANMGSGISNQGTVEVSNSTISTNAGTGIFSGFGPFPESGTRKTTTLVNNSTISDNLDGGISSNQYDTGSVFEVNNSTISGNSKRGIYTSAIFKLSNSTISDNEGDGIGSYGRFEVSNSNISGNLSGGFYIYTGNVNVSNTTISGNKGGDGGIGIGYGTVNVSNSTISGNSATNNGGGIGIYSGTVNASNSTISGNSATNNGGGIFNGKSKNVNDSGGTVNVSNSTISGNTAGNAGGGVFSNTSRSTNVRNTIIALNLLNENAINPDVSGTFTSNGYNLIGDSTGSTGFDATGDIVGTSNNPIDPRLAPLDNNGGPTQTIALLPDSPAIDAGDPAILGTDPTTDQRGLDRVSNGRADIGAFEVQV